MDPPHPSPATATTTSSPSSSSSPGGAKLRLLCSYGGRIVPRPHDKALCYAGGESRLLAVDRRTATVFSSLTSHISRTLLNGRPFCLKYQLPDHDLDSLVSVATDEDLANMMDEYDRASFSCNPSRLRFFIFPASSKAESSTADYDPRSEAWFFDALKSAGIAVDGKRSSESGSGGESMVESEAKSGGAVDSSPCHVSGSGGMSADSVFPETSSSLGLMRSGGTSVANLPAIKVGVGEEIGVGGQGQDLKLSQSIVDSFESDSTATSPNFQSPTLVYMDSLSQSDSKDSKLFSNQMETENSSSDISPRTEQLNPMQAYSYTLSHAIDQMQQQASTPQAQLQPQSQPTLQAYSQLQPQYIHAGPQYVAQYYSSAVPAASYQTTYQPYLQQQQQKQQQQQQAAFQLNNSYPVYLMHVGQAQAQCDMTTATSLSSSHPQLISNSPMMVTSPVVYDGLGSPKPTELTTKVFRTGPTASQPISVQSVSVPSEERQTQILAVAQMSQTQPVTVSTVVDGANYGSTTAEFDDPLPAQLYKTQPSVQAIGSQRQATTNAATAMLLDNLTQLQLESTK